MLNDHLKGHVFIVGDSYSIADVSAWGWISRAPRVLGGEGLAKFPEVDRGSKSVNARPFAAKVE
ncbi:glutathione binding-like protein [Paracoccus sp. JM45]|uniref:glutathione binding-like protein n=1 Tax=Paracoccus sp. JM45 TaxID=2283626 RepID=UPI001C71CA04|nr:glutathione binding-like protein [Paracoccus sp. JM45]